MRLLHSRTLKLSPVLLSLVIGAFCLIQWRRYPAQLRDTWEGDTITCLRFSPDGTKMFTVEAREGAGSSIRVRELATGQRLLDAPTNLDKIEAVELSPDNRFAAILEVDQGLRVLEMKTGKYWSIPWKVESGMADELRVHFAPDSSLLAIGDLPWKCALFDTASGERIATFPCRSRSVAFAPDSRTILGSTFSLDEEGQLWLWDVKTRRAGSAHKAHAAPISCVAFAPDGKTVASATLAEDGPQGKNPEIKLWDLATWRERACITKGIRSADSLLFTPNGSLLLVGQWRSTSVWDVRAETPEALAGFSQIPTFSLDGATMTVADASTFEEVVEVWDVDQADRKAMLHWPWPSPGSCHAVGRSVSPDGKLLVREVVRVGDQTPAEKIIETTLQYLGLARRGDSRQHRWQIWDIESGKQLTTFPHEGVFTPDSQRLLTFAPGGVIQVWDMPPRRPLDYLLGVFLSVGLLTACCGVWIYGKLRGRLRKEHHSSNAPTT